jgi:long-chain acyl-CoA synthetase
MVPLLRNRLPLTVTGADLLERLRPPVIFAANHVSHLDTPVILAALPPSWRRRVVPAMVQEWFLPHFRPRGFSWRERLSASLQYVLACGCFNAYPLPQRMGGIRRSLRYTGELLDHGYCPLVFPEGRRSADGALGRFQPGIGLMGVRLEVPVVPVYVAGLFRVFPAGSRWPKRGPVSVTFGEPGRLDPEQGYSEAAANVRRAVKELIPKKTNDSHD